jgi:hypothetical protein
MADWAIHWVIADRVIAAFLDFDHCRNAAITGMPQSRDRQSPNESPNQPSAIINGRARVVGLR